MANNIGTLVVAPIRPQNEADTFPAFISNDGQGGLHSVNSIIERNNIPVDRRLEGMLVYVSSSQETFQLKGGVLDINWETASFSSISNVYISQSGQNVTFGDVVAEKVTATELLINQITRSILYESGSTKFGDSSDDTHQFTGSLIVSGNISGNISWINISGSPDFVLEAETSSMSVATASVSLISERSKDFTFLTNSFNIGNNQLIDNIPAGHNYAEWLVGINSGSNYRASKIIAVFDNGNSSFFEINTADIGNTQNVLLSVSGSNLLVSINNTNNWIIKNKRISF